MTKELWEKHSDIWEINGSPVMDEEQFYKALFDYREWLLIQQQVSVEPVVKPESGGLSLETMIDNLPQNRILYKDSGLWMIIDEEDFNTTDKMLFQVARYQQTTKETFAQFIKRCFDSENGYYIKNY